MRTRIVLFSLQSVSGMLLATCSLFLMAQRQSTTTEESAKLKSFLRDYLHDSYKTGDTTTRYIAVFVHLTEGGRQHAIVHFTDQHSCGTGGCTTLILEPAGSSFKVITSIAIGWPPIRILTTKTNGWHDIGIWVQGGGIRDGYEADLPFDGKTYPRNPSVPPARRLVEKVVGRIVIPKDAVGVTLY